MSRYVIPSTDHLERVVGWDPPMQTYCAQLLDPTRPDDEDEVVWWIGTTPAEIQDVVVFRGRCAPHFAIPVETMLLLVRDRRESTKPTWLQRTMLELLQS